MNLTLGKLIPRAVFPTLILLVSACGGGSNNQQPGTVGPAAQVSGTFVGVVRDVASTASNAIGTTVDLVAIFRLTQSGTTVSGDYQGEAPEDTAANRPALSDSAPISGQVVGNQVQLTLIHHDGTKCPGWASSGSLTLTGDRLSGTLTGQCAELSMTESVTLDRQ